MLLSVQYLQQSEKQGHVFGVLNERVCELGTQVVCLLLGSLICEADCKMKLEMSPMNTTTGVISLVREPVGLFIAISLS